MIPAFHHTLLKELLEVDLKWNPLKWNWLLFKNSFQWSKGVLVKKEKNSLSDLSHDTRKSFPANESCHFFSYIKDLKPIAERRDGTKKREWIINSSFLYKTAIGTCYCK